MRPLTLITSWYADPDPQRRAEFTEALAWMTSDPLTASLNIWACDEGCPLPALHRPARPTFTDLLSLQNPEGINVLLNGDVFINSADAHLLRAVGDDEVWCISREDNMSAASQDAWVWRGPLNVRADFHMGVLGCDNRFAYDCAAAGKTPVNPARSIRLHHLHKSNVRRYDEAGRLPMPYLFVELVEVGKSSRLEFRGSDADRERIARLGELLTDLHV